uniref:Uncharacterized protein n=1 Tax=Aegilops tauschii subsp. strangulata TaxID=200361 RepID=A0A453DVG7_AEGTS
APWPSDPPARPDPAFPASSPSFHGSTVPPRLLHSAAAPFTPAPLLNSPPDSPARGRPPLLRPAPGAAMRLLLLLLPLLVAAAGAARDSDDPFLSGGKHFQLSTNRAPIQHL